MRKKERGGGRKGGKYTPIALCEWSPKKVTIFFSCSEKGEGIKKIMTALLKLHNYSDKLEVRKPVFFLQ